MNICFATSECVPFIKTGGLADVSGALPKALAKLGMNVKVFLPLYQSINTIEHNLTFNRELYEIPVFIAEREYRFNVWYSKPYEYNLEYYFVDSPHFFHRQKPYTNDHDEDERFIFFQHAIIKIMQNYNWHPDIIHANDWQTALLPALIKTHYAWDQLFSGTKSILSIHNVGYQGRFDKGSVYKAGLNYDHFYPQGPYELHDAFNFLKAGISFADKLTTVSPTYALEIQTPEYGSDLDGVLKSRSKDISGILNGIDTEEWDPEHDKLIKYKYSKNDFSNKQNNKKDLLEYFGIDFNEGTPVIGIISRFVIQKGFELLQPVIGEILHHNIKLIILGNGEDYLEDFFRWAALNYPDKVGLYLGYNNTLAHKITAGSDMFLMPSRYEPCGLNQMYSLIYGTIPIVRKTGGLADTVKDYHEFHSKGNGISFNDFTPYALLLSVRRALELFYDKRIWNSMIQRGMESDFSWNASAKKYLELYKSFL